MNAAYDALLVLSFGGPEGPADVRPFLENVTRGRNVPPARLEEAASHYQRFAGVSPINAANRALVAALQQCLAIPVYWGNRNWHPLVEDTVRQMAGDGVRRAACFVTSAYSGYSACHQYVEDIARARAAVGEGAPSIDKLRAYFDHPGFIEPVAANVAAAVGALSEPHLLFTAHSVPVEQPGTGTYVAQVEEASRLVASQAAPGRAWALGWQSRSGPPSQQWLEPSAGAQLEAIAALGARAVVVVPIGFVADHMEVVYDLDVVLAEQARSLGVHYARAATVGTAPQFVAMVGELIDERTRRDAPVRWLSALGRPSVDCTAACCAT